MSQNRKPHINYDKCNIWLDYRLGSQGSDASIGIRHVARIEQPEMTALFFLYL